MTGKKLAAFILLIVSMELLFSTVNATPFWRRRRRRRYTPPPPPPPPPTKAPIAPYCDSSVPQFSQHKWLIWHNKWHQSFRAVCPASYSMAQWISLFRHCQEDRIHHMRCRLGPAHSYCYWTSFVNYVKRAFSFTCPSSGFVNGIISSFDETSKDRRLRVRCCYVNGYQRFDCRTTPYKNRFGGLLNYIVKNGYTLVGLTSQHSASLGDRRWKFVYCKVKRTHGKN